jgi:SNARE protein
MTNQQLMDAGREQMTQTDQAIDRSKMVVAQTIETGTQTASALSQQTEQMKRIGNELDTVHFSLKKASQLVKEIGRQVPPSLSLPSACACAFACPAVPEI